MSETLRERLLYLVAQVDGCRAPERMRGALLEAAGLAEYAEQVKQFADGMADAPGLYQLETCIAAYQTFLKAHGRTTNLTATDRIVAEAENPNPAGRLLTEASGPLSPEASGAGGAGTACRFCAQAVDVLVRHAPPDGLSDHDAMSAFYSIFDGPEYRAAIAKNPMPVVSTDTTEPSQEDSGGGRHGTGFVHEIDTSPGICTCGFGPITDCWKCDPPSRTQSGTKVGVAVTCTECHLRKKPVGRSAPLEMANSLCDRDCPGYYLDPHPGALWPGERHEDVFPPERGVPQVGKESVRLDALTATFHIDKLHDDSHRLTVTTPNGDCAEFRPRGEHAERVLREAAAALDTSRTVAGKES